MRIIAVILSLLVLVASVLDGLDEAKRRNNRRKGKK